MYGFLRPQSCKLNKIDSQVYQKSYCGQCHALQTHFGYKTRALVSYDTTLIGLLIDAQSADTPAEGKAWCAIAPVRMPVYKASGVAQQMAATLSVMLLYAKLHDGLQDNPSWRKKALAWLYRKDFAKAKELLLSLGLAADAIDRLLQAQATVESGTQRSLADYAEPSARFSGEVFGLTAQLSGMIENETALYKLGYHIGRIVYLTDSCVDILDDLEKQQFNALLAAYQTSESISSQASQQEIVGLVISSLRDIQQALNALTLHKHRGLLETIVLQGFPARLHQQIQKSTKQLAKSRLRLPVEYLPHTALALTFCLFKEKTNIATFEKNSESENECIGCCCIIAICASFANSPEENSSQKISTPPQVITQQPPTQPQIVQKIPKHLLQKIENFTRLNSPELASYISKIQNEIDSAEAHIVKLNSLKERYPNQSDYLLPKLRKIRGIKESLIKALNNINLKIQEAYVISEANKIEGIGQVVSLDEILKEAQNVLEHSESLAEIIEETTQ